MCRRINNGLSHIMVWSNKGNHGKCMICGAGNSKLCNTYVIAFLWLSLLRFLRLYIERMLTYAVYITQVYWWAVALSIIGFIALMIVFVKCCAVHTPSSNPKKKVARKLSQTLTLRRRQAGGGGRHRPEQRVSLFLQKAFTNHTPYFGHVIQLVWIPAIISQDSFMC